MAPPTTRRLHRRHTAGVCAAAAATSAAAYVASGRLQATFVQPDRLQPRGRGPAAPDQEVRLHDAANLESVALSAASSSTGGESGSSSSREGLEACWGLAGSLLALGAASGSAVARRHKMRAVGLRSTAETVDVVAEAKAAAEAAKLELEAAKLRKEVEEMERASQLERRMSRAKRLCDGFSRLSVAELRARLLEEDKLEITDEQARQLVTAVLGGVAAAPETAGDAGLTVEQLATPAFDEELAKVLLKVREAKMKQQEIEREQAIQKAKEEAEKQEEAEREAFLASENNDLSIQTRIAAILTYVLPLIDNAQFALALAQVFPQAAPAILLVALPAQAINSIPFGTLIMFFIWATLVNNRELPRLVRFNLQQSVLLDIVAFLPGIFLSFGSFLSGGSGGMNPEASAGIFVGLLLVVLYCAVCNILGKEPDGLPGISSATRRAIDQQPGRF
eukprot:TRINITY_DN6984_c0_g1_i1.p1 TRINITY_DN6984_c0_g1~~TRINITY_DN6984_c0_g1_i1.p1  ORF type:complete len:450 (-),score=158.85 TRINITY_DN6984_c0_g1_i1:799-2148(-)